MINIKFASGNASVIISINDKAGRGAEMKRCEFLFVCTKAITVQSFLLPQIEELSRNYRVGVVCDDASKLKKRTTADVNFTDIEMGRNFDLWSLPGILCRLIVVMFGARPQVVISSTPKAGLLGMIAAWAMFVPRRIYHVRGLRYETARGINRRILLLCEWLASWCATEVVCNSHSLLDEMRREGLVKKNRGHVLGAGGACGVELKRFTRNSDYTVTRRLIRQQFGITDDTVVFGFVGRLTKDKGIEDTIDAFLAISESSKVGLILVGQFETEDPLSQKTVEMINNHPGIFFTGTTEKPEHYLAAMDIFVFASYREGFPNAPMEASAMQLPVVGYAATGVVDAVSDGITGKLVTVGAVAELAEAMRSLQADETLRQQLGRAGRKRVEEFFCRPIIQRLWLDYLTGKTVAPAETIQRAA